MFFVVVVVVLVVVVVVVFVFVSVVAVVFVVCVDVVAAGFLVVVVVGVFLLVVVLVAVGVVERWPIAVPLAQPGLSDHLGDSPGHLGTPHPGPSTLVWRSLSLPGRQRKTVQFHRKSFSDLWDSFHQLHLAWKRAGPIVWICETVAYSEG